VPSQYLDKTALNYASVFGMNKALGLVGNQYSLAASMFYIGYMVAQPFFSYFLGRFPAGKVLGISCGSCSPLVLARLPAWSSALTRRPVGSSFRSILGRLGPHHRRQQELCSDHGQRVSPLPPSRSATRATSS
jgi:MFS family permease